MGLAIPVGPAGVGPPRIAAGPLGAFGTGRAVFATGYETSETTFTAGNGKPQTRFIIWLP